MLARFFCILFVSLSGISLCAANKAAEVFSQMMIDRIISDYLQRRDVEEGKVRDGEYGTDLQLARVYSKEMNKEIFINFSNLPGSVKAHYGYAETLLHHLAGYGICGDLMKKATALDARTPDNVGRYPIQVALANYYILKGATQGLKGPGCDYTKRDYALIALKDTVYFLAQLADEMSYLLEDNDLRRHKELWRRPTMKEWLFHTSSGTLIFWAGIFCVAYAVLKGFNQHTAPEEVDHNQEAETQEDQIQNEEGAAITN